MTSRHSCFVAFFVVLTASANLVRGADVLEEVPNDALGFVVVHHLGNADAKVRSLSTELRRNVFSPLGFLKIVTGIHDGLNLNGDLLLVAYTDAHSEKSKLRYSVWLPVADYSRFMKSFGAAPTNGIVAAKVASENLLVAHRGEWALIMDPDQRERMAQLLAAPPSLPPQLEAWKKWIDSNDIAAIAFSSGVHEIVSRIDATADESNPNDGSSDDLFGARRSTGARLVANASHRSSRSLLAQAFDEVHKWTAASPAIALATKQANLAGVGIRLDVSGNVTGNVLAGLRIAFNDAPENESKNAKAGLPFAIFDNGGFIIHGAGRLPTSVATTLACAYFQTVAAELKSEEHTELDEDTLKQLNEAVERAASDLQSGAMLTLPIPSAQPIYSNQFIALRVASTSDFLNHAAKVMRLWNKANRDADGETKLVFEAEEVKLGNRTAIQHSLDINTLVGATPDVPEIRQTMEKLFGPGGKMRLWIVPASDDTVLLALATAEQVTAALKAIDRKQSIDWNRSDLIECNHLLPADADWRLFFDPHRYCEWHGRERTAGTGVPVIGGPLVRPFRDSPPIGVAGGIRRSDLWIDCAVLVPTLKSAYSYLTYTPGRRRPEVQRRLQPASR
jgi:hypothetical protein